MPSLFPYMVLTQLLTGHIRKRGFADKFALPVTVLLGMLGGSPSGAKLLANHFSLRIGNHGLGGVNSNASRRALQSASAMVTTASPMFMIASLPAMLGGTAAYDGVRIFAAHMLANIVAGGVCYLSVRIMRQKDERTEIAPIVKGREAPSVDSFFEIIRNSATSMLAVCGAMIIFGVLTSGLLSIMSLPDYVAATIASVLEMAGGCAKIATLPLATPPRAALMCAAATFGGMSIFVQNAAYLQTARVNMKVQFAAKILAGIMAFGLTMMFYLL
jgi:hypothetical protein